MEFSFGIKVEADIYCRSAMIAIKNQAPKIYSTIDALATDFINMGVDKMDYSEVINLFIIWTEDSVQQSGWSKTDEDGVSWFIALYGHAYSRCLHSSAVPFEQIFKDTFIRYFSRF